MFFSSVQVLLFLPSISSTTSFQRTWPFSSLVFRYSCFPYLSCLSCVLTAVWNLIFLVLFHGTSNFLMTLFITLWYSFVVFAILKLFSASCVHQLLVGSVGMFLIDLVQFLLLRFLYLPVHLPLPLLCTILYIFNFNSLCRSLVFCHFSVYVLLLPLRPWYLFRLSLLLLFVVH